ncbi:MAG: CheR family methyltransferase [Aggregatilineales bacterium]
MTLSTALDTTAGLEALLTYLKRNRGFDFTGYKRAGLTRRIDKRMQAVSIEHYAEYIDYLEVHPDEFAHLFDTILINVTSFFRDANIWEHLRDETIPHIIAEKKPGDPIRVWCAGCATGQEAYTIAVLLAEALGPEQFRERVKIYASDIDEEALNQARQAVYTSRDILTVPSPLLTKYFEQTDHRATFRKDLRRSIIFGRHDLVQDAPISRIDLLICRNVLMYFNAEAQSRILMQFHFALNDSGFLLLGKAEMLFTYTNLFTPTDLKRRIFTKVPRVTLRDRLMLMAQTDDDDVSGHLTKHVRFCETAFDASPGAQIVVDLNGSVALINDHARSLLGLTQKDLNRFLTDMELSYRLPELKSRIEEVYSNRRPIMLKTVDWTMASGDIRSLEIQVSPLVEINREAIVGVSITFNDVTRYKRLQEELQQSNQELETAYEEMQATNEELETTNEELQSTIEELETTNEELQSTNEELETMNEELQSTNEELETINEELRRRTGELNHVNGFLESILTSMRRGVVVVDKELHILIWNDLAEDLWGLRSNEVKDKNFLNIEIGLPVEQLRGSIRLCLSGESKDEEMTLDAINRRGKAIRCQVTCTPLRSDGNGIFGVIIIMEAVET